MQVMDLHVGGGRIELMQVLLFLADFEQLPGGLLLRKGTLHVIYIMFIG